MVDGDVVRGRQAYDDGAWDTCRDLFRAVDAGHMLEPDDLRRLGIAEYLTGEDEASRVTIARVHREYLERGDVRRAVRAAFWSGFMLIGSGDLAKGSGWIGRARSLSEEHGVDGAEAALPRVIEARVLIDEGRLDEARALARETAAVGRHEDDPDLEVLSLLTVGQTLVMQGRVAEALTCLDEVMLTVSEGGLEPPVTGLAYCSVIGTCMALSDVARAREWTAALSGWCERQSGLVPYRGVCLVHRTQIMTMQGSWTDALVEARRACELLEEPVVGDAHYALGDLHRLRGEYDEAENAYRRANSAGRQPEPGLALLRMAQGRIDAATTTLRRLYDEPDRLDRADILAACAEVMLRVGDVDTARAAVDELAARAGDDPLRANRAHELRAAVTAAEGDGFAALPLLRTAWRGWQELSMPYDAARVRARIGDCLAAVGDDDSARMEYDAARLVFERLGARPDLESLPGHALPGGLTPRECEVVTLVARGLSNRDVADRLFLSEKTVARHLSNIYVKLGISSRSAATAYAYDHGLV